jgi:hypothetical protein
MVFKLMGGIGHAAAVHSIALACKVYADVRPRWQGCCIAACYANEY